MINLILIDDHFIFGEGVANMLAMNPNYRMLGFFSKTKGLDSFLQKNKIDIVLLDVSVIPLNGIEYCQYLKSKFPAIKVLFFTMHTDNLIVSRAMKAGGNGYITKSSSSSVLFEGIDRVFAGEEYFSPDVLHILKNHMPKEKNHLPILSEREQEVLNLVVSGNTSQEIAIKLGISYKTVEFHRSNLFIKFDAKNVVDLTRESIKMGAVKLY